MIKDSNLYYLRNRFWPAPKELQIEITNRCPLACPQCYKGDTNTANMPLKIYTDIIDEAARIGVSLVNINGGEPLCHPDFNNMVRYAVNKRIMVMTYISGINFTTDFLNELNGIDNMYLMVSLNGSTEEINSLSRDGYVHAINALSILSKEKVSFKFGINWVARHDNVKDLPFLVEIAKRYHVNLINIVCNKIAADNKVNSELDSSDYKIIIDIIKNNKELFSIQSCYGVLWSQLLIKGESNSRGCPAGIRMCCINVNGKFMPCTHLIYEESHPSIQEYWINSKVLRQLRKSRNQLESGQCKTCIKSKVCYFCRAMSEDTYNNLNKGLTSCPVYEELT